MADCIGPTTAERARLVKRPGQVVIGIAEGARYHWYPWHQKTLAPERPCWNGLQAGDQVLLVSHGTITAWAPPRADGREAPARRRDFRGFPRLQKLPGSSALHCRGKDVRACFAKTPDTRGRQPFPPPGFVHCSGSASGHLEGGAGSRVWCRLQCRFHFTAGLCLHHGQALRRARASPTLIPLQTHVPFLLSRGSAYGGL